MKRILIFITVGIIAVAASVLWLVFRGDSKSLPPIVHPGEDLVVSRDGQEIFRRAFWRHPSAKDEIIQAERREWKDEEDEKVTRWQWFLEVRPSVELMTALQSENGFGLQSTATPSPWAKQSPVPKWFPSDSSSSNFDILQGLSGGLTLLHDTKRNILFATDEGLGFTSPVVPIPER